MKFLAATLLALAVTGVAPAQAAPTCGDAVVTDWSDGRIDGRYAPRCYGEAIESLPEDVSAYSTAVEDITAALGARIRELRTAHRPGSGRGATPAAGAGPVAIALLSSAGIAVALGLAALASFVAAWLRGRLGHRSTRPLGQW